MISYTNTHRNTYLHMYGELGLADLVFLFLFYFLETIKNQ